MRFDHSSERPSASETTPLLVPPTSAEEEDSQQYKPHFEWKEIVWVVSAIWSSVFLGALDGGYSLSGSRVFSSNLGIA